MPELLSDETWQRLDRRAGRLSRRDLRWFVLGSVVFAAVMATVLAGLVIPRLSATGTAGYGYEHDTPSMHYEFEIRNSGWAAVEVVGVGRDGPGLDLVSSSGAGTRIGGGEHASLGLRYDVTDCAAVPAEPWPVPVRIARPWGTYTAWIEVEPQSPEDFDLPPARASTDRPSWEGTVEWQRNLADAVCYHHEGVLPGDR
jgi:hypothetical protein